ncbi:hypothetical protein AUQ37_07975 [Candidatus Methanomethylophilus sp. 1R26]|nr:hypothetical protein AUQ37_07975 [Candidatus Methanomethylophilus sp. 1R26]
MKKFLEMQFYIQISKIQDFAIIIMHFTQKRNTPPMFSMDISYMFELVNIKEYARNNVDVHHNRPEDGESLRIVIYYGTSQIACCLPHRVIMVFIGRI